MFIYLFFILGTNVFTHDYPNQTKSLKKRNIRSFWIIVLLLCCCSLLIGKCSIPFWIVQKLCILWVSTLLQN